MNDADGSCAGTGWSALASSSGSGELAGVLAAIVFTALILVLTSRSDSSMRLQSIRLFLVALLVLGLDAFAFALVSGEVAGTCLKVWTESIVAMGMLVVGTCTALTGVAWLSVAELESIEVPDVPNMRPRVICENATQLDKLFHRSIYGITVLTIFLLATSTHDYVNIALAERSSELWAVLASCSYLVLAVAIFGLIRVGRRRYERTKAPNGVYPDQRALTVAVNAVLVHALAGMSIVGVATSMQSTAWDNVPFAVLLFLLAVALVLPAPILFMIALSVPRLVASVKDADAED